MIELLSECVCCARLTVCASGVLCACAANLTRWHVTTQDRLLHHLHDLWGGDTPRVALDLGSHASHGAYVNMSDALLFLDRFHASGSLVVGVDIYEDFALDLARRFEQVQPYAAMQSVQKLSLSRAIDCCKDDAYRNFAGTAHMHATCCADHWCHYADLEKRRKADHLCRITRMRLGILPEESWLPPSSYPRQTTIRLGSNNSAENRQLPRYDVRTITLQTLWRTWLSSRRIDFFKVDIDTPWTNLGGLEKLLERKAIGVMTIEIDGSWGVEVRDWGLSALDQLAWVARSYGYATYLKVPCAARKGRGSLEAGSWRWDWKVRKYRVAESTHGGYASWLHPLASPDAPYAPSRYHAKRPHGVQDALLVDHHEPRLRALAERCASDCTPASVPPAVAAMGEYRLEVERTLAYGTARA